MTVFNGSAFLEAKLRSLQLLDYPAEKVRSSWPRMPRLTIPTPSPGSLPHPTRESG